MTMTDEALALSGELAEAIKPTPQQVADWTVRYHQLKNVKHITDDGEVLTDYKWKLEMEQLAAALKPYVESDGPVEVEGLPPLILRPSRRRALRFDLLVTEALGEPGAAKDKALTLIDELVRGGLLDVKWTLADALVKTGHLFGISGYVVEGHGTPALMFDKRPR
jgi:hypothetical protein